MTRSYDRNPEFAKFLFVDPEEYPVSGISDFISFLGRHQGGVKEMLCAESTQLSGGNSLVETTSRAQGSSFIPKRELHYTYARRVHARPEPRPKTTESIPEITTAWKQPGGSLRREFRLRCYLSVCQFR